MFKRENETSLGPPWPPELCQMVLLDGNKNAPIFLAQEFWLRQDQQDRSAEADGKEEHQG